MVVAVLDFSLYSRFLIKAVMYLKEVQVWEARQGQAELSPLESPNTSGKKRGSGKGADAREATCVVALGQ